MPLETPPAPPYALSAAEALAELGVTAADGLGGGEIAARRHRFGANIVAHRRAISATRLIFHQFISPVVALLAAAAVLALSFGELEEGAAILVVLALNTLIGFVTEWKATRSIDALRALGAHTTRVRRDGRVAMIPAEDLVPGDIVLLDAGDRVSADLRLIESSGLSADESTLTGESVAVAKDPRPVAADTRMAERTAMLFKGTAITRGSGTGLVVATGLATELGKMTRLVLEARTGTSPLERRLARLSGQLVWATLAVAALIAAIGLRAGRDPLEIIQAATALAVAAIPEGLPIVATLTLARGMWRMAKRNALIERLSAVETLGATTVILTDKTGTLTENRMSVRRVCLPSGDRDFATGPADSETARILRIGLLCNDATLESDGGATGDPMEIALLRAGRTAGLDRAALLRDHPLRHRHAFDPILKMMATAHGNGDAGLIAVKGAPEAILAAADSVIGEGGVAPLDEAGRAAWLARAEALGRDGLRTLAFATKTDDGETPFAPLCLAGMVGLEDPPRPDVKQAIADCRQAGIRVVMVTGDHAVTARRIGRDVGLIEADDSAAADIVDGRTISALIAAAPARLRAARIFARVNPAEKLDLVRAAQAGGDIVAMTGDGVNDAPALRQADIGVAMGRRGTDVAREAAAMILLDDSFPTIVMAIRQGRIIFANIRRFVAYLLSCNLSEVMVVGLAVATSLPLPLLPLQILYLNLATDVFPAFALALGEGEADILRHPPRDPREPILGRGHWLAIIAQGAALTAGTFAALFAAGRLGLDGVQTVTVTFTTLALGQIWHSFNMRDIDAPLLVNGVTRNRWLWGAALLCVGLIAAPPYLRPMANLLHLTPPTPAMWAVIVACSLGPSVAIQTVMAILSRARRRR